MRPLLNIPAPAGSKAAGSYSRIIPAEELGRFDTWRPDALSGHGPASKPTLQERAQAQGRQVPEATAADLEQVLAQARKASYEEGYRDGLKALEDFKKSHAEKMQAQTSARLTQWLSNLDAQWDEIEPHMAQSLSQAAVRLARQVLRQELQSHPEHVVALAREAVQAIAHSARRIELMLHPDDVALVQNALGETLQARGGRIRADPALTRGGCRVQADIAAVDATLEHRWAQAAQTLGSALPLNETQPAAAEPAPDAAAHSTDDAAETSSGATP
jgi:flagellar assembly protein FliH